MDCNRAPVRRALDHAASPRHPGPRGTTALLPAAAAPAPVPARAAAPAWRGDPRWRRPVDRLGGRVRLPSPRTTPPGRADSPIWRARTFGRHPTRRARPPPPPRPDARQCRTSTSPGSRRARVDGPLAPPRRWPAATLASTGRLGLPSRTRGDSGPRGGSGRRRCRAVAHAGGARAAASAAAPSAHAPPRRPAGAAPRPCRGP